MLKTNLASFSKLTIILPYSYFTLINIPLKLKIPNPDRDPDRHRDRMVFAS